MNKPKKSVPTNDLVKLLATYGFLYRKGTRVNFVNSEFLHLGMAIDVSKKEADTRALKTAAAACREVEAERNAGTGQQEEKVQQPEAKTIKVPFGYVCVFDSDSIIISNKEDPTYSLVLKREEAQNLKRGEMNQRIGLFQKDVLRFKDNLTSLKTDYGFEVNQTEKEVKLKSKNYAVDKTISLSDLSAAFAEVQSTAQQIETECLDRLDKLDKLSKAGARVERKPNGGGYKISYRLPDDPKTQKFSINTHGDMDNMLPDTKVLLVTALAALKPETQTVNVG